MKFQRRMVLVDWLDSYGEVQWLDIGNYPGPSICQTVGFLLHTRKTHIVLASSNDAELQRVHQVIVIPKGCVTKVTRLVVSKHG